MGNNLRCIFCGERVKFGYNSIQHRITTLKYIEKRKIGGNPSGEALYSTGRIWRLCTLND